MRNIIAAVFLVVLSPAVPARADEASRLAAEACLTCHSPALHTGIPAIVGRPAPDLLRALMGFRDGSRPATVMDRLARGYGSDELGAIAALLSMMDREAAP